MNTLMDQRELTRNEITDLKDLYFYKEGYTFPGDFEHRLDVQCSKILYSLIRKYKPQVCLEFGTSKGGASCVIISALQKNDQPFQYVGFEKLPDLNQQARQNIFNKCGFETEIFGDITQNLDKIPPELDFAFIDPDWDMDGVPEGDIGIAQWTFKNIIPRIKKDGLVCIHDWSVSRDLVYEGGGFPGIFHFIDLFKQGKMPLEKLFSVWDQPDYRQSSIALSFWRKV